MHFQSLCKILKILFPKVVYAVREYAERAVDVLSRRTRLSFLDAQAALDVLPKVIQIMSRELNWSKNRQKVSLKVF